MLSATVEQIELALHSIILYKDHLPFNEHQALVKNYFLNNVGSYYIGRELLRWIDKLAESDVPGRILKAGDTAPDFTIVNFKGHTIRLKDRLRRGPALVVFYRGIWCPFCSLYLHALQKKMLDFRKLRTSVLAVSPQMPDHSLAMADKFNLEFEVLSDIGNMVARRFGTVIKMPPGIINIYEYLDVILPVYNGDDSYEIPIPTSFIIDRDGRIVRAFSGIDFMQRPDPDEIVEIMIGLR